MKLDEIGMAMAVTMPRTATTSINSMSENPPAPAVGTELDCLRLWPCVRNWIVDTPGNTAPGK
jgi:hypothetical protein